LHRGISCQGTVVGGSGTVPEDVTMLGRALEAVGSAPVIWFGPVVAPAGVVATIDLAEPIPTVGASAR